MATTKTDYQVAALAAGFTIGFGFLTVWEAMKQTRRNKNPLRSVYIYMLWGEIVANLAIGIIGWLFLNGVLGATVPVLFFILFLWVFEIQLLMQIIINRIALIAERGATITRLKWGTAVLITIVNILVFCIWIPAHLNPPASQTFVNINKYWDRASKIIILIVDAWLNWYFLSTVKTRLVQENGLVKYSPLVSFNAKLMIVSIAMDAILIGLMSLPNQVVYVQFHPVAYMVKLNIEMSMASLVVRLARGKTDNDMYNSSSGPRSHNLRSGKHAGGGDPDFNTGYQLNTFTLTNSVAPFNPRHVHSPGIHRQTEVEIMVEDMNNKDKISEENPDAMSRDSKSLGEGRDLEGDEIPLTKRELKVTERPI